MEAVDVPALYELKNVIVFPMDMLGSHPMEMSGGDLDGDPYWISNEEKLLFEKNDEPFDYHDQATEDAKQITYSTNTDYTERDVCNFFVKYIEADKSHSLFFLFNITDHYFLVLVQLRIVIWLLLINLYLELRKINV